MILNSKELRELRKEYERLDKEREKAIRSSRDALKEAKKAIYAGHNNNLKDADKRIAKARRIIDKIRGSNTGAVREAEEEYIEAACFTAFLKDNKMPSFKQLGAGVEEYIGGLSDCAGEIARYAVNNSGDYALVRRAHSAVLDIQKALIEIPMRNGYARKKYDGVKYSLERLERVLYDIRNK